MQQCGSLMRFQWFRTSVDHGGMKYIRQCMLLESVTCWFMVCLWSFMKMKVWNITILIHEISQAFLIVSGGQVRGKKLSIILVLKYNTE